MEGHSRSSSILDVTFEGDGQTAASLGETSINSRRISTRSIKRKKFDDELVESSLVKSERVRLRQQASIEARPVPMVTNDADVEHPEPLPAAAVEKKKVHKSSKSSSKRSKRSRVSFSGSGKDLGRWKPQDDLALILAVQQTCDLTSVFLGVKFSCKFTLREIQERWYTLLYDPMLSKLALQAIKQLHPDLTAAVHSKALFSKEEETCLATVPSTTQHNVEVFEDLLLKNPLTFLPGRTAKALYNHWLLMKQYHLLPDQSVQPMPKGDHVLNFSDAEDMLDDEELKGPANAELEHELTVADRRQKKEIRLLEQELPKWHVLVEHVTGISPPEFDNLTLAVIRGRLVRYLMRSKEITLGRSTKDNQIDVDLSLEGPAWKISRRQGMIRLWNTGEFYITNEGKRPIYVDAQPVLPGSKQLLHNNSVIEITCLRFIFLIHQDLINTMKQDLQKTGTS